MSLPSTGDIAEKVISVSLYLLIGNLCGFAALRGNKGSTCKSSAMSLPASGDIAEKECKLNRELVYKVEKL